MLNKYQITLSKCQENTQGNRKLRSIYLLGIGVSFQAQGRVDEKQNLPGRYQSSFDQWNHHNFHMKRQQHYKHLHHPVWHLHLILVPLTEEVDRGIVRDRARNQLKRGKKEGCAASEAAEGRREGGGHRSGR